MSASKVRPVNIKKISQSGCVEKADLLAVEEPLEIRIGFGKAEDRQQKNISVTMRTPGNDFELAAGFLFSEGIIQSPKDILGIKHCANAGKQEIAENIVRVELQPVVSIDFSTLERHFYTTSSCGVCGRTSIDAVRVSGCRSLNRYQPKIPSRIILPLPEILRQHQTVFDHTGGLHAAALFDENGKLISIREDVGRHNALDKLIGAAIFQNLLPLQHHLLLVSGRASFELVQKALMAGIPIMLAVGAPSSLAVELAREFGMTLIGFLKNDRYNIYAGDWRIINQTRELNAD